MNGPTDGNEQAHRDDTEQNPAPVTTVVAEQEPDDHAADALPGLMCQAASLEIGIGGDGSDPFDATFLLPGPDSSGREIAVWTRLTPPTITGLIGQLEELLLAQQAALGIIDATTDDDTEDSEDPHGGLAAGSNGSSTRWACGTSRHARTPPRWCSLSASRACCCSRSSCSWSDHDTAAGDETQALMGDPGRSDVAVPRLDHRPGTR